MNLYDQNYRLTPRGIDLDGEVMEALKPVMDKYVKEGFSPREVAHVIYLSALELETEAVLNKRYVGL